MELTIVYHIRRWRIRRHLSQRVLARQLHLNPSTIAAYDQGRIDIPTSRLCQLAQALDVTLSDLITWTVRTP